MKNDDRDIVAYRRKAKFRQYLAAFVANLTSFSTGIVLGWTSPMQPLLSSENNPVGTSPISVEFISWLGSINYLGAICGTFVWGISSDRLGRKYTAITVAIPFILSWIIIITAQNVWWLLIARVVVGFGCSGMAINTSVYVSEIAEDNTRGSVGSFLIIFVNAGCVFSYAVGSITSYHVFASICLSIPIIFLIAFTYFPESPSYLMTHAKKAEAEKSLLWFRGGNMIQMKKEIECMNLRPSKTQQIPSCRALFNSKGVKKALIISIGCVVGQQFCGIMAILTYTVKIFQDSRSSLSAHRSMIVLGIMQLLSSLMTSVLVDRVGRRILMMLSFLVMALSLTVLGGYLYFQNDTWNPIVQWIPVIFLSIHVISYSLGVGPVTFIIMSEIFPINIRGFTISKIQLLLTCLSFTTVKTFPVLTNALGIHFCFILYAIVCIFLTLFIFAFLPETKGKSHQAILKELNGEDLTITVENEHLKLVDV